MNLDLIWELLKAEGRLIGAEVLGAAADAAASVFAMAMHAVWEAALAILRVAFKLADKLSVFTLYEDGGAVDTTWPMTLWISGVIAVALFLWQLTMTVLRGGRGFVRLVGGPAQYGIALAVTVGMVAALLLATDQFTAWLLQEGLSSDTFRGALKETPWTAKVAEGVSSVILGLCAIFAVLPAAVGFVLEMLFRQAAILVLIATVPITAAGLTAGVTARWFWTTARWILAAIMMKPVLALTLVLGVGISEGSRGTPVILVGAAVLLMSLFAPLVLFRLFAFVDPATDAGAGFRSSLAGLGISSYGSGWNPATSWASSLFGGNSSGSASSGDGDGSGGAGAAEARTSARFDAATHGSGTGNPFEFHPPGGSDPDPGEDTSQHGGGDGGEHAAPEQGQQTGTGGDTPPDGDAHTAPGGHADDPGVGEPGSAPAAAANGGTGGGVPDTAQHAGAPADAVDEPPPPAEQPPADRGADDDRFDDGQVI